MPNTNRPIFLKAGWRYLVMLNYEIEPDLLIPLIPKGTRLDLWDGRAIVSLVGFMFLNTRVLGVPVPFHGNFEEINLRFYVQHTPSSGEVRHGIVFIRELVRKRAIAYTANLTYNERYKVVDTESIVPSSPTENPGRLVYAWRDKTAWQRVAVTTLGTPSIPSPDSETMFLSQRNWGYTRYHNGETIEYKVEHDPWRVWNTAPPEISPGFMDIYGPEFKAALTAPPRSVFVAEGSAITVSVPRFI